MKKQAVMTVLALLLISGTLYASTDQPSAEEYPRNVFYGGVAMETFMWMMVDGGVSNSNDPLSDGPDDRIKDHDGYPPALFLGYDRRIGKRIALGCLYEYEKIRYIQKWDDGRKTEEINSVHLFMLRMRWYWGWNIVRIYHGVGLGGGWSENRSVDQAGDESTEVCIIPAFQVTMIGIDIAPFRNVSFFGDVGLGYQGMLNFGAAFRF